MDYCPLPLTAEDVEDAIDGAIQRHRKLLTHLAFLFETTPYPMDANATLVVHRLTHHYLSALHYPWTTFPDWAFRFPSDATARHFITTHGLDAFVQSYTREEHPNEQTP